VNGGGFRLGRKEQTRDDEEDRASHTSRVQRSGRCSQESVLE
jgi:hypothetical protein